MKICNSDCKEYVLEVKSLSFEKSQNKHEFGEYKLYFTVMKNLNMKRLRVMSLFQDAIERRSEIDRSVLFNDENAAFKSQYSPV